MKLPLAHCTIRSYRASDADALLAQAGSAGVARYMSEMPYPYTRQHAEDWIAKVADAIPRTHFAITVDDQVVGGIGIGLNDTSIVAVIRHTAEIGYWLGETYRGRGLATEALRGLTEWAFANLPIVRLHAAVYAPNTVSARVLEKAGYLYEGRHRAAYFKDGVYYDGLLFAQVRLPETAA